MISLLKCHRVCEDFEVAPSTISENVVVNVVAKLTRATHTASQFELMSLQTFKLLHLINLWVACR